MIYSSARFRKHFKRAAYVSSAAIVALALYGLQTRQELKQNVAKNRINLTTTQTLATISHQTAIFVFTGSTGRECHGVDLAEKIGCPVIISGANDQFKASNESFAQRNNTADIQFDYDAQHTAGNIQDVRDYLADHPHIKQIIIVSSDWHLPRVHQMIQKSNLLQDVKIHYHPLEDQTTVKTHVLEWGSNLWMGLFDTPPPHFRGP